MTLYFQYCLYKLLETPLLAPSYFEPRTCFVIFHSAVYLRIILLQHASYGNMLVFLYTVIYEP